MTLVKSYYRSSERNLPPSLYSPPQTDYQPQFVATSQDAIRILPSLHRRRRAHGLGDQQRKLEDEHATGTRINVFPP